MLISIIEETNLLQQTAIEATTKQNTESLLDSIELNNQCDPTQNKGQLFEVYYYLF